MHRRRTLVTAHLTAEARHQDIYDELRSCYAAELAGTEANLPEVGSYVDFCRLDREHVARIDAGSPEVARWADFLHKGPPADPVDLGTEPLALCQHRFGAQDTYRAPTVGHTRDARASTTRCALPLPAHGDQLGGLPLAPGQRVGPWAGSAGV